MTTGERIRTARKKAGLTQRELGKRLGLSFQSIAQWENDLRNPKRETLQRIALALNVPISELCSDELMEVFDMSDRSHKLFEETRDLLGQYALALEQEQAISVLGGARIERIVYALDKMNDEGQSKAVERVEELTEIPKYQKTPPPGKTKGG